MDNNKLFSSQVGPRECVASSCLEQKCQHNAIILPSAEPLNNLNAFRHVMLVVK